MRRTVIVSTLVLSLCACGGPTRTMTTSVAGETPAKGKPQLLDAVVLRRAVDAFGDRVVFRTISVADDLDRSSHDPYILRRTLNWRLRTAQTAFHAQHTPNALVALVELWYWTATTASYLESEKVRQELGERAKPLLEDAIAMRDEADALGARALPPDVHVRLRDDIMHAAAKRELFAADSVESAAVLDQFLSATRLEKILAIPLSPFEAFGSVSQGTEAMGQLAVTADRAIDLAEKYPQILQWRMNLVALDIENLGVVKRLEGQLTTLNATATTLPVQLREQATILLNDTQSVQATTQKTLQEARAASESMTALMGATQAAIAELDHFIDGLNKPADPKAPPPPPSKPSEPFKITDYTAAAETATVLVKELRGALADLQQPELTTKAQAAADATIDRLTMRALLLIGVAFTGGLILILVARWRR